LSPDYPSVAGCVVGSADGWHVTQTLPGLRAAAWAARRSLACSPGAPPPVKGSQSTGVRNFGRISLRAVLCRERAVHTGTEAFSIGRGRPVMQLFTGISALVVNDRSEEHTSELQSRFALVCRLLLEKKISM